MYRLTYLTLAISFFLLSSCRQHMLSSQHLGLWKSQQPVAVKSRMKENGAFQFSQGLIDIELQLNADQTASGKLGPVVFKNVPVHYNHGLPPSVTGIEYTLQISAFEKLFAGDLISSRTIEIWMKPLNAEQSLIIELRDGSTQDAFPMGEASLHKNE